MSSELEKKNTMVFSVYLLGFIQYHTKACVRLYALSATLCIQHTSFNICTASISTHFHQLNVVTKNTSICQNISVQCKHILKERMI